MAEGNSLADQYARISINDADDGGLCYDDEEVDISAIDDRWCLVGKFLTKRSIDFQAMQHRMASLWQPGRGMFVKELEYNRYLFQFYHEVDIRRVIEGSSWTFDRIQLIFERLKKGENPRLVVLNRLDIWVQLHEMAVGFMSERVVRDIGNFVGKFEESDLQNFTRFWKEYLRIPVSIDVHVPLKKK